MRKYFEDFIEGQSIIFPGRYKISKEEIMEVGRRWDPQPFHTDEEKAKQSMFGELVASSVHLFAISTSLGNDVPEQERTQAETALGFDKMQWHHPAKAGDTISLTSTTSKTRLSNSRPGLGIVEFHNQLFNQDEELIFSYKAAAMIRCRPK